MHISWDDAFENEEQFKRVFSNECSLPSLKSCFKTFAKYIDWAEVIRRPEIHEFYTAMYAQLSWVAIVMLKEEKKKALHIEKFGNKRYVSDMDIDPYLMFRSTGQAENFRHITQNMIPFRNEPPSRSASRPQQQKAKKQAKSKYIKSVRSYAQPSSTNSSAVNRTAPPPQSIAAGPTNKVMEQQVPVDPTLTPIGNGPVCAQPGQSLAEPVATPSVVVFESAAASNDTTTEEQDTDKATPDSNKSNESVVS